MSCLYSRSEQPAGLFGQAQTSSKTDDQIQDQYQEECQPPSEEEKNSRWRLLEAVNEYTSNDVIRDADNNSYNILPNLKTGNQDICEK